MIFSEERISHIAHIITDCIWNDDLVDYTEEEKVVRETRKVLFDYFSKDEKVDGIVRKMITSQKKIILEGSREWEILYNKYYEEEMKKLL